MRSEVFVRRRRVGERPDIVNLEETSKGEREEVGDASVNEDDGD